MAYISIDSDEFISLTQFEDQIVEKHYPELAYLFIHVAEIVFRIIPSHLLNSALACPSDVKKCKRAIEYLKKYENSEDFISGITSLSNYLKSNKDFSALLSDILVDVYYFHFRFTKTDESLRIGYVDSEISSRNPLYLLIIAIAFSSWVGFLWVIKHLGEQSRFLQEALVGRTKLQDDISHDLKLFRIFCLQFINESSPINIRLTSYYMIRLEECWKQFRLQQLVTQINDQLGTLEKMFDWIEEINKEVRNFKIGLAAILLALISLTAVTAQLITTIDFANNINWQQRVYLISLGFIIGIISTFIIYLLPHQKRWYKRLKFQKQKV